MGDVPGEALPANPSEEMKPWEDEGSGVRRGVKGVKGGACVFRAVHRSKATRF